MSIDQGALASVADVQVGHKVSRYDLQAGEKIYKYGAPIGSMTLPVQKGEHVHMHNMQSDYIPSHTRTRQNSTRSKF